MTDLNQKPCTNCRRRKVRCDKQTVCANCARANTRCVYEEQLEGPGIAPLILDKPTTIHLFERLSGLERMVSKLSDVHPQSNGFSAEVKETLLRSAPECFSMSGGSISFPFTLDRAGVTQPEGAFPSLQESHMLIQFFLEVTEPFIRLLHAPFFQEQLLEYRAGESPLYFEPLLHCIHALTVATLSSEFVLDFFHRPRDQLLGNLRTTAEEALKKADFMRSHQPNVLRALLYFISFLFEIGDNEYASSLIGVALRAAFRIGLHHDYTDDIHFVRDRRRRIWLHLRYLDRRAASLLGVESTMKPEWDTPHPQHAYDKTWEAFRTAEENSDGEPPALRGYADTSFVLARAEIETLQDQIRASSMSFAHLNKHIHEQQEEIWDKYFENSGTFTLERFMGSLLEMHVDAVYLAARQAHHKEADEQVRGETFIAGIELLEKISALEDDMEYIQYVWVLRSFVPIQAIVTVLMCTLFTSTLECETRAWRQIDRVYARYDNVDCRLAKSSIFDPVNALREQSLEQKRQEDTEM